MRVAIPCREFTLDNGLRLIVHEDRTAPIVSVNIWYRVGSRDEQPGRTGLAHLFEHLMFEGSANVPPGEFDRRLEQAGAINNGSTTPDRTNYWETLPANAVELALFLEADRMGGLLDTLSHDRFDAQRDVVMNERLENYENRPYGLAHQRILGALYPPGHPYHWPVIGFMTDIAAATFDDAVAFCRRFYNPANASIAVAGDVDTDTVVRLADRWFGGIPRGNAPDRAAASKVELADDVRIVMPDAVRLPRLYIVWHSPPAFADGDAAMDALGSVLAAGKASRLYDSLVRTGRAVDVSAYQHGSQLGSSFEIVVTARPESDLDGIEETVRDTIDAIARDGITTDEHLRVRNGIMTAFVDELQTVGGFGGRADRLNLYAMHVGQPDSVQADLDRYLRLRPDHVRVAAAGFLADAHPVSLHVVPRASGDS
jgi:zinc protease